MLLIAHRLTSLQNTERVIVMQDGKVAEDGETKDLSSNESSLFYAMLNDQQNASNDKPVDRINEIEASQMSLIQFNEIDE